MKTGDLAVVDSGPLFAAADVRDARHRVCAEFFETTGLHLIVPTLVIAEVSYLIGKYLGAREEALFIWSQEPLDIRAPHPDDWQRIGDLVLQYGDFPLGAADASVVVLAERLDTDLIVTLDHRHFRAVRPRHCDAFRLLP